MAADFLRSHGIDLDEELTLAYRSTLALYDDDGGEDETEITPAAPTPVQLIPHVITDDDQTERALSIDRNGRISGWIPEVQSNQSPQTWRTSLVLPSLAHPHIHLDKPHLLTHEDTAHLQPETGDFGEALSLTAKAKPLYTNNALLDRGAQLLADSARAGVTHLRGFCEVDTSVNLKCVRAGVKLKRAWSKCLYVQIAVFAQDPLFSTKVDGTGIVNSENPNDYIADGNENMKLLEKALTIDGIEVLATTPYVEASSQASKRNIDWAISTAIEHSLHLDFHLDYNLDAEEEPLVWYVLERLRRHKWTERQGLLKTVCLGHCTRLTLFSSKEWLRLGEKIGNLPVYFIGLPTSDLFMQGRPKGITDSSQRIEASHNRPRSTLHVPSLLQQGFKAAIGINNIGNAFTPFGSSDPLHLAKWCVGIYQDGTAKAARSLYETVSRRAKEAMGILQPDGASLYLRARDGLSVDEEANLIVFGRADPGKKFHHQRRSMAEVVWNPPPEYERMVIYKGKHVKV